MNPVKFDSIEITSAEFVKSAVSLKGLPEQPVSLTVDESTKEIRGEYLSGRFFIMGQDSTTFIAYGPGITPGHRDTIRQTAIAPFILSQLGIAP